PLRRDPQLSSAGAGEPADLSHAIGRPLARLHAGQRPEALSAGDSGAPLPYRERTLSAQDGLRLYFRDYGDPASRRLPVLCFTGLTRNSRDYADLALRLSRTRRVLCPDYRGRGRSEYDRNWRNYDAFVYLGDLGHLLAATGIGRAIVIGTSLGGI